MGSLKHNLNVAKLGRLDYGFSPWCLGFSALCRYWRFVVDEVHFVGVFYLVPALIGQLLVIFSTLELKPSSEIGTWLITE
jgi:hypothetical protein